MKTSAKKQDKCQVKLTVELDADEVKASVREVEKVFLREAQLPGFRKGKVPLELIRREFAPGLKQETERSLFQKYCPEAVKAEKLDDLGVIGVEEMKFDDQGGSFVAVIEVRPVFKLPTYKGLKISEASVKVEESALADHLRRLREAYARYEDAKEGEAVAKGDFIQIDYEGAVDGKPIIEINPEAKVVAKGEGFWTQIEEGRFLPEILDAAVGMKIGETKEGVKAKFAKDAAPEGLGGKKAEYRLTLKAFRRRILPDDAEFVKKAKAESIEKLTQSVRESMEREAVNSESARRENEAVELLLKKVDFEVPESQVRRTMDNYLAEFSQRAQYSGVTTEYIEKNRDRIFKDAEENAIKQVRLWYVIEEIAKAEKIECEDKDRGRKVIELVLANAKK